MANLNTQPRSPGGHLTCQFNTPSGVTGITYGAQSSTILQAGDWQPVPDTDVSPQHIFRIPIGSGQKFLRLSAAPTGP